MQKARYDRAFVCYINDCIEYLVACSSLQSPLKRESS